MRAESITRWGLYKLFAIVLFVTFSSSAIFGSEVRLIKEKSFAVKDWQNLYVKASGADVKVNSWDKSEVNIKIYGNKRAAEKMEFDVYQDGDVVKVIAKRKNSFFSFSFGGFDLRIEAMVPKNFNANLHSSGGDISVANLMGGFEIKTSGGDVSFSNTNGKLSAETSGGDISLTNHKGEMDLSTSGGDINCEKVEGDLEASTSGGQISLEIANGKVHASTSGGDVDINYTGTNKGIYAATSGGDVHVSLPRDFKAKAEFESHGDIDNNFQNSRSIKVSRGYSSAELNGGGEDLHLKSTGGDIIIDQK